MRLPVAILIGFGLLLLTSCTKKDADKPEDPASQADSTAMQADSGPAATAGDAVATDDHRHGGSHGHGHGGSGQDAHAIHELTIAIGDKVPDFEVTIDGEPWMLSELQANSEMTKDGTLVLTFWCSFCHSCRHVEKKLDELAQQFEGQVGVIALDASAGETAEVVAAFAAKQGLTMPIAISTGGTAADIFGTRVTTTTVVIDSDGVLRYCGQFADRDHNFAEDALKAVLAGEEIPLKKTRQKG
jgi:thiol-disulfide isomerase/thioredoxin